MVRRRFCDFRGYAMGLFTLDGGDEGGVGVDLKVSEELWQD